MLHPRAQWPATRSAIAVLCAISVLAACSGDSNSLSTAPATGDQGGTTGGQPGTPGEQPAPADAASDGPVVPDGSQVADGAPGQPLANTAPEGDEIMVGLQANGPGEKNLISMAGDWPSWSGQYTGIYYDGATNQLTIPAPAWQGQIITGVRRFDVGLDAGKEYSLSLTASDNDAAVIIFLLDQSGQIINVTDATTGVSAPWAGAREKNELKFVAPSGVYGFYIQIQNAWNATAATNLAANLDVAATGGRDTQDTGDGGVQLAWGDRPAGYDVMFFNDEFDGSQLDRTKWCTRYDYGGGPPLQVADSECTKFNAMGVLDYANAFEEQRFRDYNEWGWPLHVVNDGTIKLLATKSLTSNWYAKYEAAAIRGKKVFKPDWNTSYFVTARVKLPNVKGTWPSIWLNPSLEPYGIAQWPPEIDIFEGPLNEVEETKETLVQTVQGSGAQWDWNWSTKHYGTDPKYNKQWDTYYGTESLRERWFTVSAEWTRDNVCFFIDNQQTTCQRYRWITNGYQEANPASLLINLAIGGPWAGRYGIDESKFPTQFELDYVRVYRKGPANY